MEEDVMMMKGMRYVAVGVSVLFVAMLTLANMLA